MGDITCIFFVPMSTIDDYWSMFVPPSAARGRCARLRPSGERSDWLRALQGRSCVNRPLGGALTQSQSCVTSALGVSEPFTYYSCVLHRATSTKSAHVKAVMIWNLASGTTPPKIILSRQSYV